MTMALEGTILIRAESPDLKGLWMLLKDTSRAPVDFFFYLLKFTSNVAGVAVENWGVASMVLTWMVHDNQLGFE